jgi:protein tyrosine phosphatase (PTP) superfamily phosphohydrolase (DUF442 family)
MTRATGAQDHEPASTPTGPTMPPPRRSWWRTVLAGVVVGVVLAVAVEAGRILCGGNLHAVLPGRVYRSGQLSPAALRRTIAALGIRTVVNLRGCCDPQDWYLAECRVTHRQDVAQEDVCLSAGRLPAVAEMHRLVEALDRAERPLLLHCQRGADRTGLASAVVELLYTDSSLAWARRQLGLRYGHLALGRPANLDWFFDLYAGWLAAQGLGHSPAVFRRWLADGYCPGPCRARLEWVRRPAFLPLGHPLALHLVVYNTSPQAWPLRAGRSAGIHLVCSLTHAGGDTVAVSKAGFFDAVVPPGGSVPLTVTLPALRRAGQYRLFVDMVEEQHCTFYQTGSEPLDEEFEAREEVASGD